MILERRRILSRRQITILMLGFIGAGIFGAVILWHTIRVERRSGITDHVASLGFLPSGITRLEFKGSVAYVYYRAPVKDAEYWIAGTIDSDALERFAIEQSLKVQPGWGDESLIKHAVENRKLEADRFEFACEEAKTYIGHSATLGDIVILFCPITERCIMRILHHSH